MNFNTPKPLKDYFKSMFRPEELSPGYKRGMVLKIYKSKIKELTARKDFAADIAYAEMRGDYEHPDLMIYMKPGSMWKAELHQRRYQIKQLINERLNSEFINEVIIR